jgi:uncharacterized protein (DUF427 family)
MRPAETLPGQESVWDYPRPPRLEATSRTLEVTLGGVTIARTTRALRVLETSHPPVYYFPPEHVQMRHLTVEAGSSVCEWKGTATYFAVEVDGRRVARAAWTYLRPTEAFTPLAGYIAFYAGKMDRCTVDGELVQPQPGGFYGGWITADIVGPFKGGPDTWGW